MIPPPTRDHLGLWLNAHALLGSGVEVGTHRGEFAETILSHWRGERLFCVDCWSAVPHDPLLYQLPPTDAEQERHYAFARARLDRFGAHVSFIRQFSGPAAIEFEDHSLDFSYIDAAHDKESVFADLNSWWPKVKHGGVFCGDDYTASYPGVVEAVHAFADSVGHPVAVSTGGIRPQWFIFKR